jgi:hypothetical protein
MPERSGDVCLVYLLGEGVVRGGRGDGGWGSVPLLAIGLGVGRYLQTQSQPISDSESRIYSEEAIKFGWET